MVGSKYKKPGGYSVAEDSTLGRSWLVKKLPRLKLDRHH